MSTKTISIGGASGFWGDSTIAAPQLLASEKLDYLVFDYLAEITMSIMARARAKNAEAGYALDFVTVVMQQSLAEIARQGVKVISNAGGVNPKACGKALEALIADQGLDLEVAVVTGDDLIGQVEALREKGTVEMFSGAEMPQEFMSVNAYFGAFPVASALSKGADIVITGRCVDSAVTLGACIHEFGWTPEDYDKLAGGSLAGHIIECGAQSSGGLFTDWELSNNWENIGYPIATVAEDGSFTVTKPEGTGGIVCRGTVAEQMVYEIGDPQAYILPDVVSDFSEVLIEETGKDCVSVRAARGTAPPETLKVSATYRDGFRIGAYVTIGGIDAAGKARKTADAVLTRVKEILESRGVPYFSETSVEIIGAEASYGPHARVAAPREVILKLAAKHAIPEVLGLLLRELTSSATSMSPGTCGMGGNRPKPGPVVRLFSFLVAKDGMTQTVTMGDESWEVSMAPGQAFDPKSINRPAVSLDVDETSATVPLVKIAYGRSGDKGNDANVGIIAREARYLPYIRAALTTDAVAEYFGHLLEGGVERYDLPGINALNFLLHEVLGGGGIASLRNDPQGKAYAQMLLDFPIPVSAEIAREVGIETAEFAAT